VKVKIECVRNFCNYLVKTKEVLNWRI